MKGCLLRSHDSSDANNGDKSESTNPFKIVEAGD